jgi:RNA polymerase sigma-70 factor (ECF subfamily)
MSEQPATSTSDPYRSESSLIEGLRRRDEAAFEALVRDYGPRLLSVAKRVLRKDSDAQDAVQEAFVSVFRNIEKFDGRSRLQTWLHRVTVNAALMKLRKRKRLDERSVEELMPSFTLMGRHKTDKPAWGENPHSAAEQEEARELVHEAIAQLPETHRDVLILRDIQEASTEEAARELGVSAGAVKTRLHRARLALRELLDPHMRGEGERS